jgi:hypothetical protein
MKYKEKKHLKQTAKDLKMFLKSGKITAQEYKADLKRIRIRRLEIVGL